MGKFLTALHVKTTGKEQFIEKFTQLMKKDGYVPCSEDEAAVSYAAAFSEGGWVTLSNGDSATTELSKTAKKIAEGMDTLCFTAEVVDSDFAILNLFTQNGSESRVIVGDGSGYGIEKASILVDMWKPLIQSGDVEKFLAVTGWDSTFVEDDLVEIGGLLGISGFAMTADHDEFSENEGAFNLSFRKAAEKKLTLNAAFKQVFGEALEPLGFKLIKSKYPYFVRVVNDEIIHYVSVASERADGRGDHGVKYKCFNVFCGVSSVYCGKIDFDKDPSGVDSMHFINNISEIYTKIHWFDLDMKYRASIMRFYYDPTDNNSLIAMLKKVLAAAEMHVLPVIEQAVTLEKCMDYYGIMEYFMYPSLESGGGDELLCTRLFSADEYVAFTDMHYERELKILERKLADPTENKANIEIRINYVMGHREEEKKKFYRIFTDPELQEKAPAELERRKKENLEKLRGYGLNI